MGHKIKTYKSLIFSVLVIDEVVFDQLLLKEKMDMFLWVSASSIIVYL